MSTYLFTSESVSMGHPDKVADQVSDAILDAMLEKDPASRVACETMVTTGMAVIAGEVTTTAYVEIPQVVRRTIKEIGYTDSAMGFDFETCAVLVSLDQQSPDISMGVDKGGAGDQGMMFGYACDETQSLMPLPIHLAHRLMERHAEVRETRQIPCLRPDAKSQVTVQYDRDTDRPVGIEAIVLSTQHGPEWNDRQEELKRKVTEQIIRPVLGERWWRDGIKIHVNPTGRFEIGGPQGDCGLTGRKIIVDTYGGRGGHGGGAFSGKDPSKVDRSASYMARYIAKNIVAADLTNACEVQLSYAIGVPEPVSVYVNTTCNGHAAPGVDEARLVQVIRELVPLTPNDLTEYLGLRKPIYRRTARHGHFGRTPEEDGGFSWERTDLIDRLTSSLRV